jgi:hypothetical protein
MNSSPLVHRISQQQPANHYTEQPQYYVFLAGHSAPSAPRPVDIERAEKSEKDIFEHYLANNNIDSDVDSDVDIDLVKSPENNFKQLNVRQIPQPPPPKSVRHHDEVDIDLVDSDNESFNPHKRSYSPDHNAIEIERKLRPRLRQTYAESSYSSSALSGCSEESAIDSYELGSFVESDNEQAEQSVYSDEDEDDN